MYWSESQGQDDKIVIKFPNYNQITQKQLQTSKINNILRNYVVKPVKTVQKQSQVPQTQFNAMLQQNQIIKTGYDSEEEVYEDYNSEEEVDELGYQYQDKQLQEQLRQEYEKDKLYNKTNKMVIKEFAFRKKFSVKQLKNMGLNFIQSTQGTFQKLQKFIMQKFTINVCQIRFAIHKKDRNKWGEEQVKLAEKNYFRRVEQSINLIMQLYQKKSTQRELISLEKFFNTGRTENQLSMLNYGKKPNLKRNYKQILQRNWRDFKQNSYVYFKILVYNFNQFFLDKVYLEENGFAKKIEVCLPQRGQIIDYIDEQRELIKISNVGLGAFYEAQYFSYFDANTVYSQAKNKNYQISPNMYAYFQEYKGRIKALVLVCRFFNQFSLKMKFSWQKIHRVQIYEANAENKSKVTYFMHLSSCPQYYITTYKNNQYVAPKFQQLGQRVQNFPLLSNQIISQNEVLRMFLYNNTVIKIDVLQDDIVHSFSRFNEQMKKIYKSYQKYLKMQVLNDLPYKGKRQAQLSNILSMEKLNNIIKNFQIPNLPTLSNHIQWKCKYHVLLLVRYNLIHLSYNGLLAFINKNYKDLELISQILLNKTIKINDRGFTMDKLLLQEIQTDLISTRQKYKDSKEGSIVEKIDIMRVKDKQFGKIYKVLLTPSGIIFKSPTPEKKCRLLKEYFNESQFFCKVSLKDDSRQPLKNKRYLILYFLRNQLDKFNILGKVFEPLASSNSQLRSSSLWIVNPVKQAEGNLKVMDREKILKFLGNFDKIQIPAKKYARIGQSFSSCWSLNGEKIKCITTYDIKSSGYMFTDGIGKISENLLNQMTKELLIPESQKKKICSIQIRYKGTKGVLTKFNDLEQNQIVLRPSMIKYCCPNPDIKKYFDILDWNKYRSGFMNRQIIILLKSLGIQDSVFEKLQQEYIEFLQNLVYDQVLAYRLLHTDLDDVVGNPEPSYEIISQLKKVGFKLDSQPFFKGVLKYIKLQKFKDLNKYCHILSKKSARLIGIIDEYKILKQGQVYCHIYNEHQDQQTQEIKVTMQDVIVTKNPALDPADVRKLKWVSHQLIRERFRERFKDIDVEKNYFESLTNCVVFPSVGKSPITAQISGSDLDGDLFFISWDQRLLIKSHLPENFIDQPSKNGQQQNKVSVCSCYNAAQTNNNSGQCSSANPNQKGKQKIVYFDQMLDFFAQYTNSEKLGTIDNSHLVHADKNPIKCANSKICKKLAYFHGKAVDYGKTGDMPEVPKALLADWFPSYMRQHGKVYTSTSILGLLYNSSSNFVNYLDLQEQQETWGEVDEDILKRFSFEIDDKRCRQMMHLLYDFENALEEIIRLLNVENEHQIYLGHFDAQQARKNNIGVTRVYLFILQLRRTFFDRFFEELPQTQKQHYQTISSEDKTKIYQFNQEIVQKVIAFYLASYFLKYKRFKTEVNEQMKQFIEKIQLTSKQFNYKGKFTGFVWFIVPKFMIYIKKSTISSQNQTEKANDP